MSTYWTWQTWHNQIQNTALKTEMGNEPRCEKTGFLHMRKQRRRSASR